MFGPRFNVQTQLVLDRLSSEGPSQQQGFSLSENPTAAPSWRLCARSPPRPAPSWCADSTSGCFTGVTADLLPAQTRATTFSGCGFLESIQEERSTRSPAALLWFLTASTIIYSFESLACQRAAAMLIISSNHKSSCLPLLLPSRSLVGGIQPDRCSSTCWAGKSVDGICLKKKKPKIYNIFEVFHTCFFPT